jgi:hypothetical protein
MALTPVEKKVHGSFGPWVYRSLGPWVLRSLGLWVVLSRKFTIDQEHIGAKVYQ